MKTNTGRKAFFKSKMLLCNALVAIATVLGAAYSQPFADWLAANNQLIIVGLSGVNVALRLITKDRVVLFEE